MSNHYNEALLERLYEEALDHGMSEEEATEYAYNEFEKRAFA